MLINFTKNCPPMSYTKHLFSIVTISGLLFFHFTTCAKVLKNGFNAGEYIGVLERSAMQMDKEYQKNLPREMDFKEVYASGETALRNKWELWMNKDKTIMAINLRGTTSDVESWMENFYSAMIPATGSLTLNGNRPFYYKFASNPKAMVHVGWAIGACSMLPDIMEKIRECYSNGIRQFIIEGHSQGGALAFLVTSYIHYKIAAGWLPGDIILKTYCSAAPKPGNRYYAYDFDYITRGGWAYTVINTADWVPQMPITIQTKNDVNDDPFGFARKAVRGQKLLVRYYVSHIYNTLTRTTRKAQHKYERLLGKKLYKQIKKYMKDYRQPRYAGSCNYAQAGIPVILVPDEEYYLRFPDIKANIFRNHLFAPYYYLVHKEYQEESF